MDIKFRLLKSHEIKSRVGSVKQKGFSLLLYKDSRVDMDILDESIGASNWQREHYKIDNALFCNVSIWNENIKEWVSKSDVGSESNVEKEKGVASDRFKRACVNWGIGSELYTSPFIWINNASYISNFNNKFSVVEKFNVEEIGYDENNKIDLLAINDNNSNAAFVFGKIKPTSNTAKKEDTSKNAVVEIAATEVKDYTASLILNIRERKGFLFHFL